MADAKELNTVANFCDVVYSPSTRNGPVVLQNAGELYCPVCGDMRRVHLTLFHKLYEGNTSPPVLSLLHCVQCDTASTGVLYLGANKEKCLVILPSTNGGLTTPHTPESVGYYLDQAYKSHNMGANSAAVAMFRAALEHLLYEQGFRDGMCGKKIKDLETAIADKTAPKWAYELDTEFLTVMKELGDGSIHPNDGDIKRQNVLDGELIVKVSHTFQTLLFLIYEVPIQKKDRLAALKAAIIKK